MSNTPGLTLRGQWLGQQLRELRDAAGLTLKQAGDYLQRDPSTVSRFESGEYPIRRPDLMALLSFYGVSSKRHREALLKLSEEVWQKGWWDGYAEDVDRSFVDYVWIEQRANELRAFDNTLMLGLLQTKEYAEAAIAAADIPERVERGVELRMARQKVLEGDNPLRLLAILDEALLHREVGSPDVLAAQLMHLVEMAQRPNIEIRVLPFNAGAHASPRGSFKVFSMADPYPDVGYAESLGGAVYVEPPNSAKFLQAYDRLQEIALEPNESVELIAAACGGL